MKKHSIFSLIVHVVKKDSTIYLSVFLLCVLVGFSITRVDAQANKTYTCSWNHDGLNTDSYVIYVDGQAQTTNFVCNGIGTSRECSAPVTMTTGTPHTVIVKAVNLFGEASSDPFAAGPPSNRPVIKGMK